MGCFSWRVWPLRSAVSVMQSLTKDTTINCIFMEAYRLLTIWVIWSLQESFRVHNQSLLPLALQFCCAPLLKRHNPSGGNLAPSNADAQNAASLFQSSYLFREGVDSLRKITGTATSSRASAPKGSSIVEVERETERNIGTSRDNYIGRSGETVGSGGDTDGHTRSYTARAYPLGKRGRGDDSSDINPPDNSRGRGERGNYDTARASSVPHDKRRNSAPRPGTAPTRRRDRSTGEWEDGLQSEADGVAVLRTSVDEVLLRT